MNKTMIKKLIIQLDEKIAVQLQEIFTHPDFLRLQASWVGLHYLAAKVSDHPGTKLKLLDVSWNLLRKDLARSASIEQTNLFHKIYEQEFGIAGGEPFGLILGDYELNFNKVSNPQSYQDLIALKDISQIAAACFAIFVCSVDSRVLGLNDYRQLSGVSALNVELTSKEQQLWHRLRNSESARFVALLLPKVILNEHYQRNSKLYRSFYPAEISIWSNAIYVYGAIFMRNFSQTQWFLDATGIPNVELPSLGGLVDDLMAPKFLFSDNSLSGRLLTETLVTPNQEDALNTEGFTVLSHLPQTEQACFIKNPSIMSIAKINNQTTEKLSFYIPYLLCVCRFAHYLKIIARNKLGQYQNSKQCEYDLQTWLNHYVASNTDISTPMKLRFPLSGGEVKVILQQGQQQHYLCVMRLRPQMRTQQASAMIELKTSIAAIY